MIAFMERGFTWIELLLVLAALGALLLMAIPSMQDGVLKRQVKDAMQLATVAEPAVAASYALTGTMPTDNKAAGLPDADKIVSQLVKSVNVSNGAITIAFGNNASQSLNGMVLTLRPAVVPDQKIVPIAWLCHDVAVPNGMQVLGEDATNIPYKWLPVECRGSKGP
jgi:type IV pilus assembly protein PilA